MENTIEVKLLIQLALGVRVYSMNASRLAVCNNISDLESSLPNTSKSAQAPLTKHFHVYS